VKFRIISSYGDVIGQFPAGQTGFAGIRLINGGQNYHGWIRLRVDDSDFNDRTDKITVFDFACNDVADQAILAGLGGMALRRRRKATTASLP
jgi:hypothetical protein